MDLMVLHHIESEGRKLSDTSFYVEAANISLQERALATDVTQPRHTGKTGLRSLPHDDNRPEIQVSRLPIPNVHFRLH